MSDRVEDFRSQLPCWEMASQKGGSLGLTCPRCGGKALVNGRRWLRASASVGRSCTYCFKTNQIPENHR